MVKHHFEKETTHHRFLCKPKKKKGTSSPVGKVSQLLSSGLGAFIATTKQKNNNKMILKQLLSITIHISLADNQFTIS